MGTQAGSVRDPQWPDWGSRIAAHRGPYVAQSHLVILGTTGGVPCGVRRSLAPEKWDTRQGCEMADAATSTSPLWLLVSTLLGFAAAFVSGWFRDSRASKREREAREAAKREQRFERRTNFQRQTLLDLHDAVMRLVRTTGEASHRDEMASRAGGEWGKQLLGEDLNIRAHLAGVQTMMLGVRVRDESVRNLLKKVKDESRATLLARNKAEADRATVDMADGFEKLNERIGELLRKLDDDEDATLGTAP